MRYILLLIVAVACSTPKEQEYIPNQEAVILNNMANELIFNLSMFDTTNHRMTYEKALKLLDSALTIDKKNSIIYDNKHQALVKLGRYNEAISTLKMATEHIDNFAEGYVGIGLVYEYLEKPELASANFITAIENYKLRSDGHTHKQRIHANCEIAFVIALLSNKQKALNKLNSMLVEDAENEEINVYIDLLRGFDKDKFIAERFGSL